MPPNASQLIERLELNPTNVEEIKGVNITPTSIPLYEEKNIGRQEETAPKKKNKLIIGVAIGVGVISIVALILLLRKK